ncbi:zn-dependent hydrolase of beta-lactamase fold family protein [Halogeometricum borinquense DSM 11551]|uniref:Predicted Zn-dependent hydrolase of beta-lactamase fold family n=1 Tax=Halogeometricum borinquense (strain ATCC 700274 / DSM 11551 / JCM 10706 / KCTC 4070 / PR3) TaxID=469382 RepID=E4NL10_HALBP|nr:MBL fold metallo-hydrolase [Halogeometricum borinquense]ADQ67162.1 predicted Zn-dependent hydrolase of beta-lactamase fold family [Halogeometricum borinquense DSM 11551]ELY29710.1 zn-dependent hydrolase of beta-lactamase fold family protein [Halogeometricum borinquense DSM 11551]
MSVSDWGDWLPRAVEDASPDTVSIWYLGCNGFFLKGSDGTTLAIDPYVGLGDPPRTVRMIPVPFDPHDVAEMDAVLATHEHTDHVHGPSQAPILESTGAQYYAPDDSLDVALEDEAWVDDYDISEEQFTEVTDGDTFEVGEFTIHVEHSYDPDATHPVSYVIEHESGTFFHGGDTKPDEEFEALGEKYDIDLGVLAFGSIGNIDDKETGEPVRTKWYSTENEAVKAASDLQFDRFLPSHWDMWKGLTADPTVLHHHAKSFAYPERLEIIEIGDRVEL